MLEFLKDEEWKEMTFDDHDLRNRYALSNYGRVISYREKMEEGKFLKGSIVGGYRVFKYKIFKPEKTFHRQIFIHKLVGDYFLADTKREDTPYVIHLDYEKLNNHTSNLKWATKREMEIHQQDSPLVKAARERRKLVKPYKGQKLTATKVKLIKKKIFDPNRKTRMKMIAKQFGISEMQLYRIKNGENWGHVTIDD